MKVAARVANVQIMKQANSDLSQPRNIQIVKCTYNSKFAGTIVHPLCPTVTSYHIPRTSGCLNLMSPDHNDPTGGDMPHII